MDRYSFSTKDYWSSSIILDIVRKYLADNQIPPHEIEPIVDDIVPRLKPLAVDVTIEPGEMPIERAQYFAQMLHNVTSKAFVEILRLEVELYKTRAKTR